MMSGGKLGGAAPEPTPTPAASLPAGTPAASGPTPEELQAQIQTMITAQSQEVEAKIKGQYDDQIKKLQQQLEESRRSAAAQDRPAPARPPERAPAVEPPPPVQAESKPVPTPAAPAPVVPAPQPTPEPQRAEPVQPAPAPVQAPVRKTQLGDLVSPGPGVTPPRLTSRLDPRYPAAAQRLNKAAQIDIRVLVDENGRVVDAQRAGAKAGFGFDEAALEAARRATFSPPTKDGVRVKMWYPLRVAFQPGR